MLICGIDPGKSGGIAIIGSDEEPFLKIMPETAEMIADTLEPFCGMKMHVFLEKAQAMPKNGAVSMFNYGRHFGELIGILVSLQFAHTLVSPATWSKTMHQGTSPELAPKKRSYQVCRRLFPEADLLGTIRSRTPHEGLIDALLIAEYGRRQIIGQEKSS